MPRAVMLAALLGAIVAVSTASLFVRFAQDGAPSLAIAAGRLAIATLVLAPFALARHRAALRALTARDTALSAAAGVLLALHFATWIASLERTSVVSSVVLVTTSPLWVALLAPALLRERLSGATLAGIGVAMAGALVIGAADARGGGSRPHALGGDLLALAGAWAMAGYLLVGRRLRAKLDLVPYTFVVYGAAALLLVAAALAAGQRPAHVTPASWGWIALLALVPQLLGHSTFNWALRHLPAALVSVALLGEPVGSALLAWGFLRETPTVAVAAGGALILAGLLLASRGSTRARG